MKNLAQALGALAIACVALSACATQLPAPTLTFDNVQSLRANNTPALALGEFTRGPGLSAAQDRSISVRADSLQPPSGTTYSAYLRSVIESELTGAGKLDPASPFLLSGQLTQSDVSTMGDESRGTLAARFQLTRGGAVVFDKEIVVAEQWPSSYWGVEAIPRAMNNYTGLYPKLFGALLADTDFQAATR